MRIRSIFPVCLSGIILCALVAIPASARDESPAARRTYEVQSAENVAYYDGPDADPVRHKLDVFYPRGGRNCPVVMLVHGGIWMMGDKSCVGLYSAVGKFLARNGFMAVLPNYRLTPRVKHPEHIKDVARAFAWTVKHCRDYGGNPNDIFVSGHSAGGHLAALLATDETYLKAEGLKRSNIRGVITFSGVYRIPEVNVCLDFRPEQTKTGLMCEVAPISALDLHFPLPNLGMGSTNRLKKDWIISPLSLVFGDDPKVREAASPISHVERGLPPFLIFYAERELPTLAPMAEEFAKALKEKRCEVEIHKAAHRSHHNIVFNATTLDDPVATATLDFIRKHSR